MRIARAALLAMFAIAFVAGRTTAADEVLVSIADVDDAAFPLMQAVVTADIDGRPLGNLEAGALRVLEGPAGELTEARIISVAPAIDAETPLALVLAMDTSGSMEGAPIDEARSAATSMIESLQSGDSAAVVSFADGVQVLQAITEDRPALLDAIARLEPFGNTALYDAVAEAAEQASASGYQRRAVVLLSDGQDFGGLSTRSGEEALDEVAAGDSIFYVVGVGDEIDRPFLEAVAERSGGRFFLASSTNDIGSVYASLEELLRSQLVVTFESTASADGVEREVEVRVAVDGGSGGATRAYGSSRPAPTPSATPAAQAPKATPPPVVAAPATDDGSSWLPLALAAALAVGLLGAVALRRRIRPGTRAVADVRPLDVRPLPADVGPLPETSVAVLEIEPGVNGLTSIRLGTAPVTIGSGPECALRLPAVAGVAPEHARIWRRDGRPMLHHIAHGYQTHVNGSNAEWASLRESDEVQIGPYVIRYRVPIPDPALTANTGGTR